MKRILSILLIAVLAIATVNAQTDESKLHKKKQTTTQQSSSQKTKQKKEQKKKSEPKKQKTESKPTKNEQVSSARKASPIEGTWYITKSNHITFRADGTTDFGGLNRKYQYLADEGQIIVSNADGAKHILTVIKLTGDQLMLSADGESYETYVNKCPPQPVTSIKLTEDHLSLKNNGFKQLSASVFPADADNLQVSWSSNYEKVAQVTPQGRVLAMGYGKATITAKALDGSGVSAECVVEVGVNIVPFNVNGVTFAMVQVEGGSFTMGATSEQGSDAKSDEKPAHQVTLSSYYIGQTEVTQALWLAVMGSNPSYYKGDNRPVENVSWNDCQTFISRLNAITGKHFRLPTEAEWEFVARGGNNSRGYKYSGSNDIDDVAWYTKNSGSTTHDVATKQANELGLYDMNGNVCEWCSDWYGSYSSSSQTNPTGPNSGQYRVYRGGSWNDFAEFCRSSFRNGYGPGSGGSGLGLRLCLSE